MPVILLLLSGVIIGLSFQSKGCPPEQVDYFVLLFILPIISVGVMLKQSAAFWWDVFFAACSSESRSDDSEDPVADNNDARSDGDSKSSDDDSSGGTGESSTSENTESTDVVYVSGTIPEKSVAFLKKSPKFFFNNIWEILGPTYAIAEGEDINKKRLLLQSQIRFHQLRVILCILSRTLPNVIAGFQNTNLVSDFKGAGGVLLD